MEHRGRRTQPPQTQRVQITRQRPFLGQVTSPCPFLLEAVAPSGRLDRQLLTPPLNLSLSAVNTCQVYPAPPTQGFLQAMHRTHRRVS